MVQKREVFESHARLSTKRATGPPLTSAFHPLQTLGIVLQLH
jgi:hypothetical protein